MQRSSDQNHWSQDDALSRKLELDALKSAMSLRADLGIRYNKKSDWMERKLGVVICRECLRRKLRYMIALKMPGQKNQCA